MIYPLKWYQNQPVLRTLQGPKKEVFDPPPLPFPVFAVWSPGPEAFLSLDPNKNAGSG